jgi:Ulp1 family protease
LPTGRKKNGSLACFQLVLMPVCLRNHWVLLVADMEANQIHYFDSLRSKVRAWPMWLDDKTVLHCYCRGTI